MKEENGIQIFDEDDTLPELPEDLRLRTDFEAVSSFGFKIVEIEGEIMWQAGTEEDYREAESKRLNIPPEEVELSGIRSCYQLGPRTCRGTCMMGFCRLMYLPSRKYYYCQCT